jgi:hypothetical protein
MRMDAEDAAGAARAAGEPAAAGPLEAQLRTSAEAGLRAGGARAQQVGLVTCDMVACAAVCWCCTAGRRVCRSGLSVTFLTSARPCRWGQCLPRGRARCTSDSQGDVSRCAASTRGGASAPAMHITPLPRRCFRQGRGALAGDAAYDHLQRGDPAPLSPERRAPRRRRRLAKLFALLRRGLRRRRA